MAWSSIECEAIVADYLDMLANELRNVTFSKAEHRRSLLQKLDNRSEGSIEYKHQNISAILIELGYPNINGYKPAYNYQQLLKETVESYLLGSNIDREVQILIDTTPDDIQNIDWNNVLRQPPEFQKQLLKDRAREFKPAQYNFTEQENKNRTLGQKGELFVIQFEQQRLLNVGRKDLADEIEWTSKEKGDGAGYDIRSFNHVKNEELFIEVKTTSLGKYMPFYITDNEVEYSRVNNDRYSLYRVFEFRSEPKLFMLDGDISDHVNLEAIKYRAGFR